MMRRICQPADRAFRRVISPRLAPSPRPSMMRTRPTPPRSAAQAGRQLRDHAGASPCRSRSAVDRLRRRATAIVLPSRRARRASRRRSPARSRRATRRAGGHRVGVHVEERVPPRRSRCSRRPARSRVASSARAARRRRPPDRRPSPDRPSRRRSSRCGAACIARPSAASTPVSPTARHAARRPARDEPVLTSTRQHATTTSSVSASVTRRPSTVLVAMPRRSSSASMLRPPP